MKTMKDISPRRQATREDRKKRCTALSDTELIEAIIGRGTKNKDVRVLSKEIYGLVQKHREKIRYDDLAAIDGIGPSKASQIMACFELSRRYSPSCGPDTHITKPEDILPHISYLREKRQEHFVCLTLNGAGEVLGNQDHNAGSSQPQPCPSPGSVC